MNLRLLPLLGVSASALLALKLLGFTFGPESGSLPINGAVAQETPAEGEAAGETMSAEVDTMPAPAAGPSEPALPVQPVLPDNLEIGGSAAERAVLESLGRRRESLQEQKGQLDLREKLLQATEERIQKRVDELKVLEQRIEAVVEKKRQQELDEVAGLVTMYETMKPKDAARIFNRLSLPILLKVVRQMKPRKMADVLAKMSPEAAERLTVAIASNSSAPAPVAPAAQAQAQAPAEDTLPKIPSN
ncbi:MotE family protein [Roseibium sp.]|uniref:MotE family protein n=1 Tax=Roseibium sp. TaxID=1936156 RepID=UPI003B509E1A